MKAESMRRAAVVVLLVAVFGAKARRASADEPDGILTAAQSWYAALDAGDEAAALPKYAGGSGAKAYARDLSNFRGFPVEFGQSVVRSSGTEGALQLHSGSGHHHLSLWKRLDGGWKLDTVVGLNPELFVGRRQIPAVASWPIKSAVAETPANVLYGLAGALQTNRAKAPSQKELEERFLRPSGPADRAGYPEFLQSLRSLASIPDVDLIKESGGPGAATAKGPVGAGATFEVHYARSGEAWRIVSATRVASHEADSTATGLKLGTIHSAFVVARKAVAALAGADVVAFSAVALDLAAPTPRALSADDAAARIKQWRAKFGTRFTVSEDGSSIDADSKRVSFAAAAPEAPGDWKHVRFSFVVVGGTWWLLDVSDGLTNEWLAPTEEEVVPPK